MKEKFLEKRGFTITFILAVLDAIAVCVTIYFPDGNVKMVIQIVNSIVLEILSVIFVMYLISCFEDGI